MRCNQTQLKGNPGQNKLTIRNHLTIYLKGTTKCNTYINYINQFSKGATENSK